jgi:hypothetical protein
MLDRDLADLYEVGIRALHLAIERNRQRLPVEFMFQLTQEEYDRLRSRIDASKNGSVSRVQNVINSTELPYAFTQLGVVMLSSLLDSDKAINMHIAVVKNFISKGTNEGERTAQLNPIYEAIENQTDIKAGQKKWDDRERIGFRSS